MFKKLLTPRALCLSAIIAALYAALTLLLAPISYGMLQCRISEGIPNVLMRYRDGSGKEYQYLLTYNGVNGEVQLTEPEQYLTFP